VYVDSRKLKSNKIVETDICIVGAGAAGITLALEFINKSFRVCLLESGGFDYDSETDDLSKGILAGRNYDLVNTRARLFGGTTNTGAGTVSRRPLILRLVIDLHIAAGLFQNHLDPYYKRAHKFTRLENIATIQQRLQNL
jgi:choline dehydrogenase-like flavoprotein